VQKNIDQIVLESECPPEIRQVSHGEMIYGQEHDILAFLKQFAHYIVQGR
jgi:hypothetical protein